MSLPSNTFTSAYMPSSPGMGVRAERAFLSRGALRSVLRTVFRRCPPQASTCRYVLRPLHLRQEPRSATPSRVTNLRHVVAPVLREAT